MDVVDILKQTYGDIDYGVVNIAVKKFGGHITSIDSTKITTYKPEGNVEGMTIVSTLLKKTAEATKLAPDMPTPPTVTFTVMFDRKGEMRQINVSDFNRTNIPKK